MTRWQMIGLIAGIVIAVSLMVVAYYIRHAEEDPDDVVESWRRRR
jgi:hypothetical protein